MASDGAVLTGVSITLTSPHAQGLDQSVSVCVGSIPPLPQPSDGTVMWPGGRAGPARLDHRALNRNRKAGSDLRQVALIGVGWT